MPLPCHILSRMSLVRDLQMSRQIRCPIFSGAPRDWPTFARQFSQHLMSAGYLVVLHPLFPSYADYLRWSPATVQLADAHVYQQLWHCCAPSTVALSLLERSGVEFQGNAC